ncbi:YsnF/AvaK domain-containing protein [Nocardioides anomalus]|uniref:YsnF/AvaK domain-containing protein n=2 Tax=Nocardioides anomalus TaxID=2712223 RepID=A0A6G6WL14_9ACTN|nr:YsnF/AvaK domain-containing protein [Nocardioides anomalus]
MTRSEEQLRVGTTSQESGRARLRKYVTTEMETRTVPVRKERAVLETEPINDEDVDQAHGGPAISEEEHEVVLHEEVPVVEKSVQAVERVRLGTETVTEDETLSEEVRTEHIEAEGDVDGTRR